MNCILECIIHQRDINDTSLPIRRMIGPFLSFEDAHTQMTKYTERFETILIHILHADGEEVPSK